MNSIPIDQLAFFSVEAIISALLVLGLLRIRSHFGLSPLYVTLGVFQPIQVLLASSLYAQILPEVIVSPGSVTLFTASLTAILLVYILEDALETRKVIYGIIIANLTMTLLLFLFGLHLKLPSTLNFIELPLEIFHQNARVMFTGTVTLFADVLLIIFVFEIINRRIKRNLFLSIYLTLAAILIFDSLGFYTGAFYGQSNYRALVISGMIGKLGMAVFYAAAAFIYLRFFEPKNHNVEPFRDIYSALTYRAKYESEQHRGIQTEKKLRVSEQRYRRLFDSGGVSLWEENLSEISKALTALRLDGVVDIRRYLQENKQFPWELASKVKVLQVNRETLKMFGAEGEEEFLCQIDRTFGDSAIDIFKEELYAIWEKKKSFSSEANFRSLDGKDFTAIISFQIPQTEEDFRSVPICITDITDRKQAEEELKSEQFRLSEIIRGTNSGIWEWNIQTGDTIINERWAGILGYTLAELPPLNIESLRNYVHPDDLLKSNSRLKQYFNGELDHYELQFRMKHKDGRWIWVLTSGKVSSWTDTGKPLLMYGTHTDIDERKRAEEQRQTIERLNTVGTLAGGIAHDFNNILAGLYGNISLAKKKVARDHPGFKYLEASEKSMQQAILLTNQLLTFAKGGAPVKESLNLGCLVEEVVQFNLSGSNVRPIISFANNLWLAKADQGQIQQVFGNLTINAKQAMPDGGHLRITMVNTDISNNTVKGLGRGKYIHITVADEGIGIAPEHLDRIFDPYFTTKHTGSGLGLATIYSIIKRHGGHISVVSQLGKGSTFTLYLPASDLQELPASPPAVHPIIDEHSAKILVMDDEDIIRNTVTAMLEELNFSVETTVDGKQAVARYQKALDSDEPFDLVILDLTIPGGVGGVETARTLLALDPAVKMIVSSGYADDTVMANYLDYGFIGVITKPYDLNKLSAELTRVLEVR